MIPNTQPQPTENQPQISKPSNKNKLILLAFAVFSLILGSFIVFYLLKKPEETNQEQIVVKEFVLIKKNFSSLELKQTDLIPKERFVIFAANYGCLTKKYPDRSKLPEQNKNLFLRQSAESVNLKISDLEDFANLKQSYQLSASKYQNDLEILQKIGKLIKSNCPHL